MDHNPRFLSTLTKGTLALVLAHEQGGGLVHLTRWRPKAMVPFGGNFRLIDFALSNCVNSDIRRIGVLTEYKSFSLNNHLADAWSLFRSEFGEFVRTLPASKRIESTWYAGSADAVYQNLDVIRGMGPDYVLIVPGDQVYKMDYGQMIARHAESNVDVTLCSLEVDLETAKGLGVIQVGEEQRVCSFQDKPEHPEPIPGRKDVALVSTGIYVFNTQFLFEQVIKDADTSESSHNFGADIIPSVVGEYRVMAYPFQDEQSGGNAYWEDVGDVDAYWSANLELIGVTPRMNLYDANWPIWTRNEHLPGAKFQFNDDDRRGMAVDSVVSGGCLVSGAYIEYSMLFTNVRVNSYAKVKDSVILPDVDIGRHVRIHRAVVDSGCMIPDGTIIGEDPEEDAQRFYVTPGGVVLVSPEMLGQELHPLR